MLQFIDDENRSYFLPRCYLMRKVYIFEAKSGDVLAVDIYGPNGAVLLAKGVKLIAIKLRIWAFVHR